MNTEFTLAIAPNYSIEYVLTLLSRLRYEDFSKCAQAFGADTIEPLVWCMRHVARVCEQQTREHDPSVAIVLLRGRLYIAAGGDRHVADADPHEDDFEFSINVYGSLLTAAGDEF